MGIKEYNTGISVRSSLFIYLLPAWIFVKLVFPKVLAKLRRKEEVGQEVTYEIGETGKRWREDGEKRDLRDCEGREGESGLRKSTVSVILYAIYFLLFFLYI